MRDPVAGSPVEGHRLRHCELSVAFRCPLGDLKLMRHGRARSSDQATRLILRRRKSQLGIAVLGAITTYYSQTHHLHPSRSYIGHSAHSTACNQHQTTTATRVLPYLR